MLRNNKKINQIKEKNLVLVRFPIHPSSPFLLSAAWLRSLQFTPLGGHRLTHIQFQFHIATKNAIFATVIAHQTFHSIKRQRSARAGTYKIRIIFEKYSVRQGIFFVSVEGKSQRVSL